MTEQEINQLVEESLDGHLIDTEAVKTWLQSQLQLAWKTEQEEMCAFKFHKFMGKHEQMKQNATNLKDIRTAIDYFQKEIDAISHSGS